jgi:hypothetical protein
MQRFLTSLIVVDGINATIKSYAQYNSSQQTTIQKQSSSGFWPFYWDSGSSTFQQNVSFAQDSSMTYTVTSQPGNPLIIGATVLPAGQYLGGNPQFVPFLMPRLR